MSFLCWAIWKARCMFVYQHKPLSPHLTISWATNLATEFQPATTSPPPEIDDNPLTLNRQQAPQPRPRWIAPPPGYSKVNCDAAWKPPYSAGLGVIIRNTNSELICGSASISSCGSAGEAEATALLHGVSLAASMNPILEKIRRKATSFEDCIWEWIPREANRAAHIAASLANGSVGLLRWANQPPPSLTSVLRNDGLPCPPTAER